MNVFYPAKANVKAASSIKALKNRPGCQDFRPICLLNTIRRILERATKGGFLHSDNQYRRPRMSLAHCRVDAVAMVVVVARVELSGKALVWWAFAEWKSVKPGISGYLPLDPSDPYQDFCFEIIYDKEANFFWLSRQPGFKCNAPGIQRSEIIHTFKSWIWMVSLYPGMRFLW